MKNSRVKSKATSKTPEAKTDQEQRVFTSSGVVIKQDPSYQSMKKAVKRISQDRLFAEIKDFYGIR